MNLLPANLASIAALCLEDTPNRYTALTGVKVDFAPDGSYTVVATDGSYLGIATGPSADASEYPATSSMMSAPNTATSALIPAGEWTAAFKALPKKSKRGKYVKPILTENVVCVPGPQTTCLASTDGRKETLANVENVQGRFPHYEDVIPKATDLWATIDLSPRRLRELLAVAEKFTDPETDRITLELYCKGRYGSESPIIIRAKKSDGQQFTGLLMPLA